MNVLFSSQQCAPKSTKRLPYELCFPDNKQLIKAIANAIQAQQSVYDLEHDNVAVYIATDNDDHDLWSAISRQFPSNSIFTPSGSYLNGKLSKSVDDAKPSVVMDAYLLANSNYFLGNCISSYSAFASRYRIYSAQLEGVTAFFNEHLVRPDQAMHEEL